MTASTFVLRAWVPKRIEFLGKSASMEREDFFSWVWSQYGAKGLVGVHEGTLLSEEAAEKGLETDSWTVDAAQAPRERDWVSSTEATEVCFYFESQALAEAARVELIRDVKLEWAEIFEQKAQDWDAEWKASFLNAGEGVEIPPFWRIVPPWKEREGSGVVASERWIRINPGAGFGTGTHETTQLCLRLLGEWSRERTPTPGFDVLDFGSGSGILSFGAAILGAKVDSVEIDPLAIENAQENAGLNHVAGRIRFDQDLGQSDGPFDVVLANILRPVLIQFCPELVRRLRKPGGVLILSGLIESDVPQIVDTFSRALGCAPYKTLALNEWRALAWKL